MTRQELHETVGHTADNKLDDILEKCDISPPKGEVNCVPCKESNMRRVTFPPNKPEYRKAQKPLEVVHMDVLHVADVVPRAPTGERYCLVMIDEYGGLFAYHSRLRALQLL